MKKRISCLFFAVVMALSLIGCGKIEEVIDLSASDGSVTYASTTKYNKEKIDEYAAEDEDPSSTILNDMTLEEIQKLPTVTEDGTVYYVGETQTTTYTKDEFESSDYAPYYVISDDGFYTDIAATFTPEISYLIYGYEKITLTVKFADEIVNTNGTLSSDKKSVVFDMALDEEDTVGEDESIDDFNAFLAKLSGNYVYYAYTSSSERTPDTDAVTLTNQIPAEDQEISVSVSKKTYKAATLKKGKKTFNIGATANTKLTYKVTKGSKYITVSKTGKVTVKKGTPKGTYKIKITAKAQSYDAATKTKYNSATKTIKVVVK